MNCINDIDSLREDLGRLETWSKDWQMLLILDKNVSDVIASRLYLSYVFILHHFRDINTYLPKN